MSQRSLSVILILVSTLLLAGCQLSAEDAPRTERTGPASDETHIQDFGIIYPWIENGEDSLGIVDSSGQILAEIKDLPQYEIGLFHPGRDLSISPDGTRMVYAERGERSLLFVRTVPDGDDAVLFDDNRLSASNPVWSPDAEWIAFERVDEGHAEIYLVRPDGSDLHRLTNTEEGAGSPVWAPDGERLAFLSPGSWEQHGRIVDANPAEYTPFQIHVVNVDGSDQRALPDAQIADPIYFVAYNDPDSAQIWSPDGNRLAFIVHEEHQDRDGAWSRLAIYDLDAGEFEVIRKVVGEDVSVWGPSWSYSGEFIMLVGGTRDGTALYRYGTGEDDLSMLLASDEQLVGSQLSPDDTKILTGRYHEQGMDLFVFDLERNELITIAENISSSGGQRWVTLPDGAGD